MGNVSIKVLAKFSKEGLWLYVVAFLALLISAIIFTFICVIKFDIFGLIFTILLYLFSFIYLIYFLKFTRREDNLLLYDEDYLYVKNKRISWNEIKTIKVNYIFINIFKFKYGYLNIRLNNSKGIYVYRVANLNDVIHEILDIRKAFNLTFQIV